MDAIDAEILSVFPTEKLLTPDGVRGPFETLKQAILNQGWPSLNQSKGKLMFALDNSGEIRQRYLEGHPSLQGRVLFTDSMLNDAEAAFFKRDNPFDSEIPELVRQGYLVLTRADADTIEARLNDSTRRDTALASGAQFISTDYPVPDLHISPYSVSFREGTTLRCNPINSPSGCSFNAATIPEPSSLLGLLTFCIGCVRSKFLRQKKGNQK
ncbi:MAG: Ca2+-dependent phosphoinositide-specific phospholipase C [Microcystaceae cyanobacterium]